MTLNPINFEKLFYVSTIIPYSRGRKNVEIFWKPHNRKQPIAHYLDIISKYEELNPEDRKLYEGWVDFYFTKEEAYTLCDYFVGVINIDTYLWQADPLADFDNDCEIESVPGCPLNISVIGHYSLEGAKPVPAICSTEEPYDLFDWLLRYNNPNAERNNYVEKFFDVLGNLTGVYFRREGLLKPTFSDAPSYKGTLSDLMAQINKEISATPNIESH